MVSSVPPLSFSGRVASGRGRGASFTQLGWVRERLIVDLGIAPYPGTLNLVVDDSEALEQWRTLRAAPGRALLPPSAEWCRARCYSARVGGRVPAAIILPDVPGYAETQVEIVAALCLREFLSLRDGDRLPVQISRPLPVRAVIFDVDGTLVDSLEAYRVVAELTAAPYGITVTLDAVRHALNTGASFWELLLPGDHPDRAAMARRLRDEAGLRWPQVLREHGRAFSGLRPMLDALQARGVRLGIMTGSRQAAFEPLREQGLLEAFTAVVTGKDVQRRKPDPEGLLKCAAALGVPPAEAVYVGDTPLDVQASCAAGMASVAVLSGAGDSALLSAAGPDWIICALERLQAVLEV